MEQLIKEIEKQGSDGAILYKLKADGRVSTISPCVKATNIDEMYNQLSNVRDAIQQFLQELIDKKIKQNGQGN